MSKAVNLGFFGKVHYNTGCCLKCFGTQEAKMKRISALPAACASLLLVSACIGLICRLILRWPEEDQHLT